MQIDVFATKIIIQRALDLMETAACWERKAAKKAHICGLQGEKRRLRYLSRDARNIVDWLEHIAYDVLKVDICAQEGSVDVSTLVDPKTTMEGIISKLWTIYNEVHQIANELVVAKFKKLSEPLYCYSGKLFDILQELQRSHTCYEFGKYEYHHVSRYQVGWENVHDEYEEKEESQGYNDHK